MILKHSLILGGFAAVFVNSPAFAGKKEDAWAICAWEKAPITAANWINMSVPDKYPIPGKVKPNYALKIRLDAACQDHLIEQGIRRPRAVSYKKIHQALKDTAPDSIPQTESDPLVYVCLRYFANDTEFSSPTGERWGYGSDFSKTQFGSSYSVYSGAGGKDVSLSPDGLIERCKYVQSDGSLLDA